MNYLLPESFSFQHTTLIHRGVGIVKLHGIAPFVITGADDAHYYVSHERDAIRLHEVVEHLSFDTRRDEDRIVLSLDNNMIETREHDPNNNYVALQNCAAILNAWRGYHDIEVRNDRMNKNNRQKLTKKQLGSLTAYLRAPYGGNLGIFDTAVKMKDYLFHIDRSGVVYECHMTYDEHSGFVDTINFCVKEDM
jgi:hypothetical protein